MKKLLIAASLTLLFACQKEKTITENTVTDTLNIAPIPVPADSTLNSLRLDTFGFPAEVSGCSCYFSTNRNDFENGKYVYIDDYGNKAYLKIDGKEIEIKMSEGDFDENNFNKVIKNKEYTVTLKGKKVDELEEVMMFEGSMTVEHKSGAKTVTPIYGECGC